MNCASALGEKCLHVVSKQEELRVVSRIRYHDRFNEVTMASSFKPSSEPTGLLAVHATKKPEDMSQLLSQAVALEVSTIGIVASNPPGPEVSLDGWTCAMQTVSWEALGSSRPESSVLILMTRSTAPGLQKELQGVLHEQLSQVGLWKDAAPNPHDLRSTLKRLISAPAQADGSQEAEEAVEAEVSNIQQAVKDLKSLHLPAGDQRAWYLEADKNPKRRKVSLTLPAVRPRSVVLVRLQKKVYELGPSEFLASLGWGTAASLVMVSPATTQQGLIGSTPPRPIAEILVGSVRTVLAKAAS